MKYYILSLIAWIKADKMKLEYFYWIISFLQIIHLNHQR